jgi:eukaryotic-like serine/threonine-protein kinase
MNKQNTPTSLAFNLEGLSSEDKVARLRGVLAEVKKIASGGMAHIFRVRQPSLGRYIVVKKLKDELYSNPETLERFRREAKALASVLHQNIAHVYDFVESGRDSFLLMEYIEGIDLSTVIQKLGQLPPDIAASILLNVARGVNYIHAHHLIHRDIKPSNIRLTTRGEVKLMDFGIVIDIENTSLTRPGMMVGSPSYLSPEQVLGDPITASADIFLLGITLYEMLTGTRPFKEAEKETVFQRIRETKYVPARKMNSAIPKKLDQIIQKCLKKRVEDRYLDVKDLIADLESFLGPQKSTHTADLVLKHLDQEALLNPSMAYSEVLVDESLLKKIPWRWALAILFAVAVGFAAGFFSKNLKSQDHLSYPSAKSILRKGSSLPRSK